MTHFAAIFVEETFLRKMQKKSKPMVMEMRLFQKRHLQSTMEEVGDVEEWTNIHCGYAYDAGSDYQEDDAAGLDTSRSRSRGSNNNEPQARTMPKPRAKQVAGRIAMDTALDMAEAIENSGAGPSSSMEPRSLGVVKDSNYLLSSVPVANFFHIMPVPREPLALHDYRWDLLGQGIGPENLLVIKC